MDNQVTKKTYLRQLANELHKRPKQNFPLRKVYSSHVNQTWSCDLVDMSEWASFNSGYKWMLNCVDLFSRYAYSVPMKDKKGKSTAEAFKEIIEESGHIPEKIWVDHGKEFYNKDMEEFAKQNHIEIYSTYGTHKSVIVERFNKTLKTWMFKEFTAENTRNWIDMLPMLIRRYNTRVHSTIKMSPIEALKKKNFEKISSINNPILSERMHDEPSLKVGDMVRISRIKGHFEKGYIANWSQEVFKIKSVDHHKNDPTTYTLEGWDREPIEGFFYESELQKVKYPNTYLVEEVLKTKGKGKNKQYFVKWLGWPESFNSWIKSKDIVE